ncbi:MAG: metal-sulfur cluster assembly factor [Myxococcales bacterium]|nr:metal-sulfur cluster assembly factor [Myxococcales bacterium]
MSLLLLIRSLFSRSREPVDFGTPTEAVVPGTPEARVLEVLTTVLDPELGISIVDLGLIYGIRVAEHAIEVTMTMTTPACPMGGLIKSRAREAIRRARPDSELRIRLVWNPPWTASRISSQGRAQLGFD